MLFGQRVIKLFGQKAIFGSILPFKLCLLVGNENVIWLFGFGDLGVFLLHLVDIGSVALHDFFRDPVAMGDSEKIIFVLKDRLKEVTVADWNFLAIEIIDIFDAVFA